MSDESITRICWKCKQSKQLSEFHKNIARKNGHQYICKSCQAKVNKKYKQSRKNYSQTNKGKTIHRNSIKRYQKTEKGKANQRRYINRNRKKHNARSCVMYAIKVGKLPHPNILQCYYCGIKAEQYHHHKGYASEYKFDVIPVCLSCHWKIA